MLLQPKDLSLRNSQSSGPSLWGFLRQDLKSHPPYKKKQSQLHLLAEIFLRAQRMELARLLHSSSQRSSALTLRAPKSNASFLSRPVNLHSRRLKSARRLESISA